MAHPDRSPRRAVPTPAHRRPGGGAGRVALLSALAAAALAGCAGGAPRGATTGSTPTAAAAAAPAAAEPAATSTAGGDAATATTAVASMTSFRSPTGNITCLLAPVAGASPYVRCDLARATWDAPEPPGGCAFDWHAGPGAGSVGLGGGPAQVLCVSDTVIDPAARELPYGAALSLGPIVCTSRSAGMTCENTATGHSFTASRDSPGLR